MQQLSTFMTLEFVTVVNRAKLFGLDQALLAGGGFFLSQLPTMLAIADQKTIAAHCTGSSDHWTSI